MKKSAVSAIPFEQSGGRGVVAATPESIFGCGVEMRGRSPSGKGSYSQIRESKLSSNISVSFASIFRQGSATEFSQALTVR